MSNSILILGRDGQMGRALTLQLGNRARALGRAECDLLDGNFTARLDACVKQAPVTAVINAAAYTQVDKAQGEDRAKALRINGSAVGELAAWCKKNALPLVHYSTDYVFDGSGNTPRNEDAPTAPINAYGESKLAGENAIRELGGHYLIMRTSWIYDAAGKNFFTTIRRMLSERESLRVVSDQVGAPTYAAHLAAATLNLLDRKPFPTGLYHLCSSGETSWHGFASAILAHEKAQNPAITCQAIHPIPSTEYPLPAPRPLNSRLDCTRARQLLGITLPSWQDGLSECIAKAHGLYQK